MGDFNNQTSDPLMVYQGILNLLSSRQFPQVSGAYTQQALSTILPQILGTANAQLTASAQNSPVYNQMMVDLYRQYGPQLSQIGSSIGAQQQQAQADTNASVANSASGQAALQAAINADRLANPEFYAARAGENEQLTRLMSSIDLTGKLSGGEEEALRRSVARQNDQTGTSNVPSAINTAANAMQFGEKTYQRQEQAKSDLTSALNQATAFLPASRSGINPENSWNIMTGGPTTTTNTSNASLGLFQGPTNYSGLNSNNLQNNLSTILGQVLGNETGMSNTWQGYNSGQPTTINNVSAIMGGIGGLMGGMSGSSGLFG